MSDGWSELTLLARELGTPYWAQGPGGNISVKLPTGELWVKASGTRISAATTEAAVAKVPLELAVRALNGSAEAEAQLFSSRPRPSLETHFHALGAPVVAHTHAVGVLLAVCSTRLEALAGEATIVPYQPPGSELARAIRARGDRIDQEQVFLLQGHGVVVYAQSAARALELTRQIDARLTQAFGPRNRFEDHLAAFTRSEIAEVPGGFCVQLQETGAAIGPVFPDAAVYATHVPVGPGALSDDHCARALQQFGRGVVLINDAGQRRAVGRTRSELSFVVEVAAANDYVRAVLDPAGLARELTASQISDILQMPAEKYRLQLTATAPTC